MIPALSNDGGAVRSLPAAPEEVAALAEPDVDVDVVFPLDGLPADTPAAPIVGNGALGSSVHPPAVELGQEGTLVLYVAM